MAKNQNADNNKCWWGFRAIGTFIYCWWECKMIQSFWKLVWQFLTKWNMLLIYDWGFTLFGIYPNELKTSFQTKTCTWEVYSGFNFNSTNLEASWMSFNSWMYKHCGASRQCYWSGKWQPTPVFLPENPTDRGTSWAMVYGVTVRHD